MILIVFIFVMLLRWSSDEFLTEIEFLFCICGGGSSEYCCWSVTSLSCSAADSGEDERTRPFLYFLPRFSTSLPVFFPGFDWDFDINANLSR